MGSATIASRIFWIGRRGRPGPERGARGLHRLLAGSVDAFHAAALEAGATDNGDPGVREIYHPNYYGAFVLDPDHNNVEAVCHKPA